MNADRLEELLERRQRLESLPPQAADYAARLSELRAWQSARLERTYRDLHQDPRYSGAVEFFLSDLYGPEELVERNRNLTRALRYLRRALPAAAVKVLQRAIELDVASAELDHAMVNALPPGAISEATYAAAYRAVGMPAARVKQIELTVAIGADLDRIVQRAWLGPLLRAAHAPARAAGLGALQDFLERGYDAFRRMQGAGRLLNAIKERETDYMRRMLGVAEQSAAAHDGARHGPGRRRS